VTRKLSVVLFIVRRSYLTLLLVAIFCCNSGKRTFSIKQSPCESFFSAVTNSISDTIALTSGFVNSPIGNKDFESCSCDS
jgi:hypothetical protein